MSDSELEQADPFELRLQFSEMLRRLTASTVSLSRAARFATRWKAHADVLYAVLMESMETAHLNQRLNLFHLCDHICMATMRIKFQEYATFMLQDMEKIIRLVCGPVSQLAMANCSSVRKVLESWRKKGILPFSQYESLIQIVSAPMVRTDSQSTLPESLISRSSSSNRSIYSKELDEKSSLTSHPFSDTVDAPEPSENVAQLSESFRRGSEISRAEIVRRMEEDRERHKQAREESWIRVPDENLSIQFEEAWNSLSPLCSDDLIELSEELNLWKRLCVPQPLDDLMTST